MPSSLKKLLAGLVCILLALAAIGAAAAFYIQSGHARRKLETWIDQEIPGAVSWEETHLSLIDGTFALDRVRLKDPAGKEVAFLERLQLQIAWQPLFKRQIVVRRLLLTNPKLSLSLAPDGTLNLLQSLVAKRPSGAESDTGDGVGPPLDVVLQSFLLTRGSVSLALQGEGIDLRIGRVDIEASADLARRSGRLSLQGGQFEFLSPDLQTGLDRVELEIGLREGRIDPLVLSVANEAAGIELSGSVDRIWDAASFDLSAQLRASLSKIGDMLAFEPQLAGELSGSCRLQGTLQALRLEGTLDVGQAFLFTQAIEGLHLVFELKDQLLRIKPSEVRLAGGRVGLTGSLDLGERLPELFTATGFDPESLQYRLDLKGENLLLERFLEGYGSWRGPVAGTVTIEGKGVSPLTSSAAVSAQLSGDGISGDWLRNPADLQIAMTGRLEAGTGILQHLEASAGPIALSAAGRMNFSTEEISADMKLNAHGLNRMVELPELAGVTGRIQLEASAGGTLKAPVFQFDLQSQNFRYQDVSLGEVKAAARLDRTGVLQISAFDIANRGSTINGSGSLGVFAGPDAARPAPPLNLAFRIKNVSVADFISPSPVEGRFDGRLAVSGSLAAPEASLSLKAQQVSVMQYRAGDIDAGLRLSGGRLHIDTLVVTNRKSSLAVSGSAALLDPNGPAILKDPDVDITFSSRGIFLEDISPAFKGTLTAKGDVRGSLSKPRGALALTGRKIDLGYQKLEEVSLSAVMDGSRIQIENLSARLGEKESVRGSGWFRTDGSFALDLTSDGVSLASAANGILGDGVDGKLSFDFKAGGTLHHPRVEGNVRTRGLALNGKPVEDADLSLSLVDDRLRVQGRLNFDVDCTIDLPRKDIAATVLFDRTALTPYFKAAGQTDLGGEITGKIRVRGSLAALERLNATADIETLRLELRNRQVLSAADFHLSFADGTLSVPPTRLVLPGESRLAISGTGRLNGPVDFALDGNIPVSALGLLTEEVNDLRGQISLKGRLKGSTAQPDLAVEVAIVDAGLTVGKWGQRIDDVQGNIQITDKEIRLPALTGRIGGGKFRLDGKAAMADYRPVAVHLNLDASAVPVEIPDTLSVLLNSRIELSGTPEDALAKGELVLLEGSYYKDLDLSLTAGIQSIATRRRELEVGSDSAPIPFLDRIKLDIGITQRHPFLVQNNLADLEVHPDLSVRGTLQNPILTGRAKVEAGTVTYSKTVFDIQKGVIDFNNPYRTVPDFDIEAQSQVRDWLITLTINGTPETLDLKLASDPPLGSSDIASLLLFGKTAQELSGGSGAVSKQSASNMLAELLASTYAKDIKDVTGLDVFELQAETDSQTDAEHITVTVGKEISERMTLKYAAESKNGEFIQRAIAEYKVLEHLLLSGFQDSSGSFGGSVTYRLEFR